jgi:ALG6, ALG8 glycosyltransferase family
MMSRLQVHEKSILMPMTVLSLLAPQEPWAAALILPVASFSLFPLLQRDGQVLPYIALTVLSAVALPLLAAGGLLQQSSSGKAQQRGTPLSKKAPAQAAEVAAPAPVIDAAHNEPPSLSSTRPVTGLHGRAIAQQLRAGKPLGDEAASTADPAQTLARAPGAARQRRGQKAPAVLAEDDSQQARAKSSLAKHRRGSTGNLAESASTVDRAGGSPFELADAGCPTSGPPSWAMLGLFALSYSGMVAIHAARVLVEPPTRLPYLHDAALSAFTMLHFAGLFTYITCRQLGIMSVEELWE